MHRNIRGRDKNVKKDIKKDGVKNLCANDESKKEPLFLVFKEGDIGEKSHEWRKRVESWFVHLSIDEGIIRRAFKSENYLGERAKTNLRVRTKSGDYSRWNSKRFSRRRDFSHPAHVSLPLTNVSIVCRFFFFARDVKNLMLFVKLPSQSARWTLNVATEESQTSLAFSGLVRETLPNSILLVIESREALLSRDATFLAEGGKGYERMQFSPSAARNQSLVRLFSARDKYNPRA